MLDLFACFFHLYDNFLFIVSHGFLTILIDIDSWHMFLFRFFMKVIIQYLLFIFLSVLDNGSDINICFCLGLHSCLQIILLNLCNPMCS